MTKRILLVAVTLCLALVSGVRAQGFFADVKYTMSIGLGSATIIKPDEFEADYKPAFGFLLDVGAQKKWVDLVLDFDYNFFIKKGTVPDDINILNIFLLVKIKPMLESKARPYILGGGGYYRFWIFDLNHYENVLGGAVGAGIEVDVNKRQRIFIEGKYVMGKTRDTPGKTSTSTVPVRIGITWSL